MMWSPGLFVPGAAKPQGSKNVSRYGSLYESSKGLKPWRAAVNAAARFHVKRHSITQLAGVPVQVDLTFILPRPKATPKTKPTPPAIKKNGDIDKLTRAILDALTGVWFDDDCLVTRLTADKRIAEIGETPGVVVNVNEVTQWTVKVGAAA